MAWGRFPEPSLQVIWKIWLPLGKVDAVFAAFDKNGDGTLSREEFETVGVGTTVAHADYPPPN